ncbi:FMN-dependent NADH-azoreductase [Flavobacterium microcysteis]|uniref:FMN dependent NADH:quinone oxidoreductase n=1 Tax=Flavobacterium microcysteis TaxID=2596891 RepID=A0A501QE78_9FLAO|nr:NAD(P)H-dependent oxidoreductase [Flavobacterium microcysteis]TPD70525.1 FMN-dependent NADH-azoreductase [Flavobacterium microcysteis]
MKLLRLITSFKGNESLSFQLGNAIVEKIKTQHPEIDSTTRNLTKNEMPHLNELHFNSFMTPTQDLTAELKDAVSYSDEALKELLPADIVVIDVPMYNLSIPSSLKAWIDHIVRAGITFRYSEEGIEGLLKDKKVFLAIASGGIFSEGPLKEFDLTEKYLRNVLGFIGITDITVFRVEGTAMPQFKDEALPKALESVAAYSL